MAKKILRLLALALCLQAACSPALAQQEITAVLVLTNVPAGLSSNLTLNAGTATTRYWTNSTAGTPSTSIQQTNTIAWSRTNLLAHFLAYPAYTAGSSSPTWVVGYSDTNSAALYFTGPTGTNFTLSVNGLWARVSYFTNTFSAATPILNTTNAMSHRARTNAANSIANLLAQPVTNALGETVNLLSNFVARGASQTLGNKTFTNSVADYSRITNASSVHGSNATIRTFLFTGGSIVELTNLSGHIGSGALTNGTFWSNVLARARSTNGNYHGVVHSLADGVWTNAVLDRPMSSNLVNYGNALRSEGVGVNSFQVGSNAVASADFSQAMGNSAVASNSYSIAVGPSAKATNGSATAVGYGALAGASGSVALGANANALGSLQISIGSQAGAAGSADAADAINIGSEANAYSASDIAIGTEASTSGSTGGATAIGGGAAATKTYAVALGRDAVATHQNSIALGASSATTKSNEVMLGTSSHHVAVPGILQAAGISNLVTVNATNILRGDLSFPRFDVSTVAAGHNVIDIGTNIYIRLTGSPGSDWTLGGITSGSIRDGKFIIIENRTGYSVTIQNESGTAPTAAERILTLASSGGVTNATLVGDGVMMFHYNGASSRWILDSPDVDIAATSTNSVSTVSTNGVVVSAAVTGLNFTNSTAYSVGGTVFINPGVVAGSGEANYNGEVSVTNATRIGLVHSKSDVTNRLRSLSGGNGIVLTNEGTNIVIAATATGGGSGTDTNSPSPDQELVGTSSTTSAWMHRNAMRARPDGLTNIVVTGDSLGTVTGGSVNWPFLLTNSNPLLRLTTNSSAASQKAATILSNYATYIAPWAPSSASNKLLIIQAGINDLAQGTNATQLMNVLSEIYTGAKSNGYYIMAVTLTASGHNTFLGQETNRILFNQMLKTNQQWDYLFDAAAYIPHVPPWYTNDMLHYSNLGKEIFARGVIETFDGGLKNPAATRPIQNDAIAPLIVSGMRDTNNYKALSHLAIFRTAGSPNTGWQNEGDDSYFGLTVASGNTRFYALAAADASVDYPADNYLEFNTSSNAVHTSKRFTSSNTVTAVLGFVAPYATASRPAFINAQGVLTNASGTPDGTKFLRDDGVLAVPSGGGGSVGPGALDFATTQFDTNLIVHLKAGALMTNMNFRGSGTNRGDLYVDNAVFAFNLYSDNFAGDFALVSDPTGEIIESQLAVSDLEALPSRQWGSASLTNLSGNPRVATNVTVLSPQSDLEVSDNGSGTWQIGKGTNFGMLHVTNYVQVGNEVSGGALRILSGVTNASGGITNVGVALSNSNPALVGFQMDSPFVDFIGNGWKTTATAASQPVGMREYFKPTQGTTTPTGSLLWMPSTNGVLGNTAAMSLTTGGGLLVSGYLINNGGNSGFTAAGGMTATSIATTGNFGAGQGSAPSGERIRSTNATAGIIGFVVDNSPSSQTNLIHARSGGLMVFSVQTNGIASWSTNHTPVVTSWVGTTNTSGNAQIWNVSGTSGSIVFYNRTGAGGGTAAGVALWTNTVLVTGSDIIVGANCALEILTGSGVIGTGRNF